MHNVTAVQVRLLQELHFLTQGVNQQRSIAEARDQDVLDNVELEIAKMRIAKLKANMEEEMQQVAVAGVSSSASKLRGLAAQLLQSPLPKGSFAPSLNMIDL